MGGALSSVSPTLVERMSALYGAELINAERHQEPKDGIELPTAGWSHWWNAARSRESRVYAMPMEIKAASACDQDPVPVARQRRNETQGASPSEVVTRQRVRRCRLGLRCLRLGLFGADVATGVAWSGPRP